MRSNKGKNFYLEFFRALLCIAVLLYHLNILKGGYLAVCSFFVLTAFLSLRSLVNKEELSLKNYYLGRLKRVYLPLAVTVFCSVAVISLIKDVVWVSLKPETLSVLLGYNNFWQLQANLDYFARHTESPFMHFWYIGILLQFELVFPVLFILLKKAEEKIENSAIIILAVLSAGSTAWFIVSARSGNIMNTYYNSFCRAFSLIYGLLAYFLFRKFGWFAASGRKAAKNNKTVFSVCILILLVLFIFIGSDSSLFAPAMIVTSIISCLVTGTGIHIEDGCDNLFGDIVRFISKISYELYLVQYPVIYVVQCLSPNEQRTPPETALIIVISIILAYILHVVLDRPLETFRRKNYLKSALSVILAAACVFGCIKFIAAKDITAEMKELEEQLAQKSEEMLQKQQEYALRMQEESRRWEDTLKSFEEGEAALEDVVKDLNFTFIGDSVMLGASGRLLKTFTNGYCDSAVSRTSYAVPAIIRDLLDRGILGNPVVFHLGTNGAAPERVNREMVDLCGDRDVFMINASNEKNVHVDDMIKRIVADHTNVRRIDWLAASEGHKEYFVGDGVHLTKEGQEAYTQLIFDSVYNLYLNKINEEKEKLMNEHEKEQESRIAFFGDDLLLSMFDDLLTEYPGAGFNTLENAGFEVIKHSLEQNVSDGQLPKKIIFAFGTKFRLSAAELDELFEMTKESEIYTVEYNGKFAGRKIASADNIHPLDWNALVLSHPEYLMNDKVHLNSEGAAAAAEIISKSIK